MKRLQLFFLIAIVLINKIYGQDTLLISTKNISNQFICLDINRNGVIKSDSELKSILNVNKFCLKHFPRDTSLPLIDFKKNDLISVNFGGSGKGMPKVETFLYKITSQKKYFLLIKETNFGETSNGILMHLNDLVEKTEESYSFEFKVENKYLNHQQIRDLYNILFIASFFNIKQLYGIVAVTR